MSQKVQNSESFKRKKTSQAGQLASPPSIIDCTAIEFHAGEIEPKGFQTPRLIPIEQVCQILGLKKSAVHDKVALGLLPGPLKFGESRRAASRWIEKEIHDVVWAMAARRNSGYQNASDIEVDTRDQIIESLGIVKSPSPQAASNQTDNQVAQ